MNNAIKYFKTFVICTITLIMTLLFVTVQTTHGETLPVIFKLVKQVNYIATGGNETYSDVWGEGNYAYVGTYTYGGEQGVGIIDISKPEFAFLAGVYSTGTGTTFTDVKVHNGIGYFANDSGNGVHIVDLSDPTSPSLLFELTSAQGGHDNVHNVFIDGSFLYIADSRTPIVKVFDVSNPSDPKFVRDIITTESLHADVSPVGFLKLVKADPMHSDDDTEAFIHDITIVNNRLYTSGWGGFTDIYDVTDIATRVPILLGSVETGSNSHSNWATSDGNILISAREIEDGDIRLFDISDPSNPSLLSTINRTTLGIDAYSPHNPVLFNDNLLFVSWYEAGVIAFDISDPLNPEMVGSYDTNTSTDYEYFGNWGVYPLLGLDKILLSDLKGGLFIVDASALTVEENILDKVIIATLTKKDIIATIEEVSKRLKRLPNNQITASKVRRDFVSICSALISKIKKDDYTEALEKLNEAIIRMDGCAVDGAPDDDDWIIDCDAQANEYRILQVMKDQLLQKQ